jgi:hypothetical protein
MNARTQITLDPDTQRRAHAKAAELGISFAEYVRRLIARDQHEAKGEFDISVMFDLVDEGRATNIARDKDKMVNEAIEHERSGPVRKRRTRAQLKIKHR